MRHWMRLCEADIVDCQDKTSTKVGGLISGFRQYLDSLEGFKQQFGRFEPLLQARLDERLLGINQRNTKYYINPRYTEIMTLLTPTTRDQYLYHGNETKELRGYMISGNLYVWKAYDNIHVHGRESLHREFGIGKDPYSGRPLIIALRTDGTLAVMLGGIRKGYFVTVGEATINKSARLKAAVTPPSPLSEAELRESPEMQAGFEMLARLLLDNWSQRIGHFARNRAIRTIHDLAAGTFDETFKNSKHLKKLPDRLKAFVKQAINRHLRLVADLQTTGTSGQYVSHDAFATDGYTPQPEIYLYFAPHTFQQYLPAFQANQHWLIDEFLAIRFSTLLHELRHAYDDCVSGGRHRETQQARTAKLAKDVAKADPSPDNLNTAHRAYLLQPHEISARFNQTVASIGQYLHGAWQDYLHKFKSTFIGWQSLPAPVKRRLLTRLGRHWVEAHKSPKPIDITPFVQKLNNKLRALSSDLWVTNAHGNIELDGLDRVSPTVQMQVLQQASYLADIFQRQVITNDNVPMLKGFEFVANKGRNIDYRISARYHRRPKARQSGRR